MIDEIEWINCKDRMPSKDLMVIEVLLYTYDRVIMGYWGWSQSVFHDRETEDEIIYKKEWGFSDVNGNIKKDVLKWAKLPEPSEVSDD